MHKFKLLLVPLAIAAALSLPVYGGKLDGTPSDAELEGDIRSAFQRHGRLGVLDIDVDVQAGQVRLSGNVPTPTDVELAKGVTAGIDGVVEVDDSSLVAIGRRSAGDPQSEPRKTDFAQRVQDMTLQADVRTKLLASDEIDGVGIQVSVKDGIAVLEGSVDSETTRQRAERIAREVRGIEHVDNLLVVGR